MPNIYGPTIKSHELRGDKKSEKKVDEEYSFCMPLRRLQYKNQVPYLFDNPNKIKEQCVRGRRKYDGKIIGINVRLVFNPNSTSNLCAKTQKSLNKAHKEALERLSKVHQDLEDYLY